MAKAGETTSTAMPATPAAEAGRTWGIAELAAEFGLTARTIRHYEDEGLIAPARAGLTRVYGRRDRARLALICRGKRLGFTLAEIRDFLDLYDIDEGQVGQMAYLLDRARARIGGLERQLEDVRRTLDDLRALETAIVEHLTARGVDPETAPAPEPRTRRSAARPPAGALGRGRPRPPGFPRGAPRDEPQRRDRRLCPLAAPLRVEGRAGEAAAGRPGRPGGARRWSTAAASTRRTSRTCILGCAFPEGEQGFNMARLVVFLAGLPEQRRGDHGQPVLRLLDAGDPHGGRGDPDGRGRGLRVRRGGEHEPGPMLGFNPAPNPRLAAENAGAYMSNGRDRGEPGAQVPDHPRGPAGLRGPQPTAGPRRRGRPGTSPTRWCRSTTPGGTVDGDRHDPPGHQPGGTVRAEAGLRQGRHGDRRHVEPADRRRLGDAGHLRGLRQGQRPEDPGPDPILGGRRLRPDDHGHRPGAGDEEGPGAGEGGNSPTSASSS